MGTAAGAGPTGAAAGESARRAGCSTAVGDAPPRPYFTLGGRQAFQLICDEHPRDILAPFEQLAKELRRGFRGPAALPQDVEPVVVLIHGPPEGMVRAVDRAQYCIEGPRVAWPGAPPPALIRRGLTTLVAPLADGFVCYVDPAGDQQRCDVPEAEAEDEVCSGWSRLVFSCAAYVTPDRGCIGGAIS